MQSTHSMSEALLPAGFLNGLAAAEERVHDKRGSDLLLTEESLHQPLQAPRAHQHLPVHSLYVDSRSSMVMRACCMSHKDHNMRQLLTAMIARDWTWPGLECSFNMIVQMQRAVRLTIRAPQLIESSLYMLTVFTVIHRVWPAMQSG